MALLDPNDVLERIRGALGPLAGPVALHEPWFHGREWELVKECLDSGWVSSAGQHVGRFEEALSKYVGGAHVVAAVNGTAALHVCLKLVGVMPGEEVIVPTLTFVATANAVSYCGATPHLADVDELSLGLDPVKLADHLGRIGRRQAGGLWNRITGRRIAAMVPVHTFGQPADIDALLDVANEYGLPVVEDAAESLGSYYKGRPTGLFGRVATISFNGNKIVTTGAGGAIVTEDAALASRARHITTTAKAPHPWAFIHDEVGFNYRLPNINAALGIAQLEMLPDHLARKRQLAQRYIDAFADCAGATVFRERDYAKSNYWLNCLLLDEANAAQRDRILELTNGARIMTRPVWELMHRLPMYRDAPAMDLSTSESLARRIVNLPSSPQLVKAM
jgi:perosamine synthetase